MITPNELIVDGMLSGTGVRDALNGGYVHLSDLKIPPSLIREINKWLSDYEMAHFLQYTDEKKNKALDKQGIQIANHLKTVLPNVNIRYYSNWLMKEMRL